MKWKLIDCNQRYYTCTEIKWLLKYIGFRNAEFYGFKHRIFERDAKLSKDDFEILILAEK